MAHCLQSTNFSNGPHTYIHTCARAHGRSHFSRQQANQPPSYRGWFHSVLFWTSWIRDTAGVRYLVNMCYSSGRPVNWRFIISHWDMGFPVRFCVCHRVFVLRLNSVPFLVTAATVGPVPCANECSSWEIRTPMLHERKWRVRSYHEVQVNFLC